MPPEGYPLSQPLASCKLEVLAYAYRYVSALFANVRTCTAEHVKIHRESTTVLSTTGCRHAVGYCCCTNVWFERNETSTVDDDDFKPKCQASTVHWFTQCPSRPVSSKQVRGIDGGRELGRRTRQRIPSPTRRTDGGGGVQQPVTYNGV